MDARILDLDGSLLPQEELRRASHARVIDLSAWGPRIRIGCSFGRFRRFEQSVAASCGAAFDAAPAISFLGSGDFHHVSLALVRRRPAPFNLLVIDNHPDWMRGVPIVHCGTWLHHATRSNLVRQVFHVGGDVDFDNWYRWLAPWPSLRRGRIAVFPALRRFGRGRWKSVPTVPLLGARPLARERVEEMLAPFRGALAAAPLYISLDKDAMRAEDAPVNWDSGHLGLEDVCSVLSAFLRVAGGRLAGMDVVGDWSPVKVQGALRRYLDWSEHVPAHVDPARAARRNEATNLKILETISERACAIAP